ncbi:MAG: GTPase HflX [Chloroflexota bacterium]|nr:GTPase HflX [Chloroflexota bacterium]
MRDDGGVDIAEMQEPRAPVERGFLVGVEPKREHAIWTVEDSLAELAQLARTAGIQVVGQTYQRLERITPATFVGKGKVEELVELHAELGFDVLVFDDELSPRQQRELEEMLGEGIKVVDRTALILDIFARHAHTREGALQVELAQYEYRLPRLTRAWTHLARQTGGAVGRGGAGGVGLRGPGETQLEVDRRRIRERIARLKRELEDVRTHRRLYRQRRQREGMSVVALVGYTNAGKSTLLNALSGAGVFVADQLFATLDPTTRRVGLPQGQVALFTDTVGFIQKLPTQLVAAFRATLEEVTEADLLLHVIDVTHPNVYEQVMAVHDTLVEIGATEKPVINALNKIDRFRDPQALDDLLTEFPDSIPISALRLRGLDVLLARIEDVLQAGMVSVDVIIPYERGDLVSYFHERGQIDHESHTAEGTHIRGRLPHELADQFQGHGF